MKAGLPALMADNSVPDAARVVGFHIATHDSGDGVELRHATVATILHGWPGEDKVRATLRVLCLAGYVERVPGGRDHGDSYRWLKDRVGVQPHPKDRVGLEPHPKSDLESGSSPTLTDRVGVEPHSKAPPPPPILPSTSSSVDARVHEAFVAHPELTGLRGALTDYLKLGRVDSQYHYTMAVLGWLGPNSGTDPSVWLDHRAGESLYDGRQAIIAGCLNELASCDEVGRYFTKPPGHIDNLRTKIRFKVRSILGGKRDAVRHAAHATGTGGPPPRHLREVHIGE